MFINFPTTEVWKTSRKIPFDVPINDRINFYLKQEVERKIYWMR